MQIIPQRAFQSVTSLTHLYLDNNAISTFEGHNDFVGLSKLIYLNLQHNKISSLPESLFQHLSSLKFLVLNGNKISKLEGNSFTGLSQLYSLQLRNNSILRLKREMFTQLPSLSELRLENNVIRVIERNSFIDLKKLHHIYLANNSLKSFHIGLQLPSALKTIDLSQNPLECDCMLKKVINNLTRTVSSLNVKGNCISRLYPLHDLTFRNPCQHGYCFSGTNCICNSTYTGKYCDKPPGKTYKGNGKLDRMTISLIASGGFVFLALVVLVVCFCVKRYMRKKVRKYHNFSI